MKKEGGKEVVKREKESVLTINVLHGETSN
jgi:hypothetical protein